MISQINIAVNAAKPKFPLPPMVAFNGSPSSVRISGIPKTIGEWNISSVKVVVSYPTNVTLEKQATFVDGLWIATVDGSQMNGVVKNGFQIIADGVDEIGNPVTGYVLGVGDVVVLERDKGIEKLVQKYAMRYLNEPPTNPSIGDLLNLNGNVRIWDGSKWISVSGQDIVVYDSEITLQANGVEFGSFTVNSSEAKTIDIPVPSKVSELNNDIGYITASQVPPVPSKVSELDNDAGYITMSAIPAIPSKTSDLDNDSGFITASAIPSQISSFENDVGYITASQVQPYSGAGGFQGYARNALGTILVYGRGPTGMSPDENVYATFDPSNQKLARVEQTQYPWVLSMYNGTTFDPSIEMTYGYRTTLTYLGAHNRRFTVQVNSNCWVAGAGTTNLYYILATEGENGNAIPDENFHTNNTSHPITFSTNKLGIETIDGESGNITCTRQGTGTHIISQNYYAYEDAIPSNVSQLTNDAGYITASAIPSDISSFNNDVGYLSAVTWNDVSGKPNIPSQTSDLVNDSGFITANDIPAIPSKTSQLQNDSGFITSSAIPSNVGAFTNDVGYVTASTVASSYYNKNEIDGMIGSINTILDNINGEVI